MNGSGKRFYKQTKFWVSIIVVLILISLCVLFVITITSDSYTELRRIKRYHSSDGTAISYTLCDHSETTDYTDSGEVLKLSEKSIILNVVESIKISKRDPWESLDTHGGGRVSLSLTLTYPDNSTLLLESNSLFSRYTLTLPDGTVFKESCTFDAEHLLGFAIAHYVN